MEIKSSIHKIKGMNKDLSYSSYNPEYSYHNKNIRLTARDSNNLLSITNEKGNLELILSSQINGTTLGYCSIGNYLAIFSKDISNDYIYRVEINGHFGSVIKLYEGDLGFNLNNKIQALPFYENNSIQKVYWIDGLNQPRYINIANTTSVYDNTSFDFVKNLDLTESVGVTKQTYGGSFKSGVIQYAFTYFNSNGSESNIVYITPIQYISPSDRGGKVDELVSNSFKLDVSGIDQKFEYIRIYSIYRTSVDTTPEVKKVVDLVIDGTTISYVDTGSSGEALTSDYLLYVGGEEVIPKAISQKNNTLFLGNISLTTPSIDKYKVSDISSDYTFSWEYSDDIQLESNLNNKSYSYLPKLNRSTSTPITNHWKFDEAYRFGIQGQYSNGRWSSPIWVDNSHLDLPKVNKRYKTRLNTITGGTEVLLNKIYGRLQIGSSLKTEFNNLGFVKIRPLYVPLSYNDRNIIAQGLLTNTIGTVKDRLSSNVNTSKFALPDYMLRFNDKKTGNRTVDGKYAHFDIIKLNNWEHREPDFKISKYIEVMGNTSERDYLDVFDYSNLDGNYDRDFLFVDKNTVNFWSPEIYYNYDNVNQHISSVDAVALYGFSYCNSENFKIAVDGSFVRDGNINIGDLDSPEEFVSFNYSQSSSENLKERRIWVYKPGNVFGFPMWSPERYHHDRNHDGSVDVDSFDATFTKLNRSSYNYFGWVNSLKNNYAYRFDVNTPNILNQDSTILYKSNSVDNNSNGGNILYSKNVEKVYIAENYSNLISDRDNYDDNDSSIYHNLSIPYSMYVKYNTAQHALFSFKKIGNGINEYMCMPRTRRTTDALDFDYISNPSSWYRGGTDGFRSLLIDKVKLNTELTDPNNELPIFDLYKTVINQYGGTSSDAIFNNTWIPCGDPVRLSNDPLVVNYTDGDTYISRFDMLRVFPNDTTQVIQQTEIVSFICESFVNTDGRSDVNRYNTDSSLMTQSNYGLLNNIYSQKDNYFSYTILNPNRFNINNFPTTITWTKTKTAGELTDTWTNISMLSTLDLEGINGEIKSINLWNNELYAFQPKAIARLLYNERVQQTASDGVSIELANGYVVPGYRYLTNQYGCDNNESIVEGKNGIYFIDRYNKSLNLLSNGIQDISAQFGFKSWFSDNIENQFILSYDKMYNDIYIHSDTEGFNFSEVLSAFESFNEYYNVSKMQNIGDDFISIKSDESKSTIWLHNKGEYNRFYDDLKQFSVEYIINPQPLNDKIFNSLDYRLDNDDLNWNGLDVSTYYQDGSYDEIKFNSKHKKRFNVHRLHIPRQTDTLNRIRSTWMKLKLSRSFNDINIDRKLSQQDMTIWYTI